MPDISSVWLNNSKPYIGTIGKDKEVLKLKINISEQNRKNDQEYFVSGYSLVDKYMQNLKESLPSLNTETIKKRNGVRNYELAEEKKESIPDFLREVL
jgi:hypothetical protein